MDFQIFRNKRIILRRPGFPDTISCVPWRFCPQDAMEMKKSTCRSRRFFCPGAAKRCVNRGKKHQKYAKASLFPLSVQQGSFQIGFMMVRRWYTKQKEKASLPAGNSIADFSIKRKESANSYEKPRCKAPWLNQQYEIIYNLLKNTCNILRIVI